MTITEILLSNGYGHRPVQSRGQGSLGVHEIFSLNTMEVVAEARADGALKAVGIDAE